MRSDVWKFDKSNPQAERIVEKVEKVGLFCELSPKNARNLRLLAEEMISLVNRILPHFEGELFVENEDRSFQIQMKLRTLITPEERDVLLDTVGGKNSAFGKGIFGKIAAVLAEGAIMANDPEVSRDISMTGMRYSQGFMADAWLMSTYVPVRAEAENAREIRNDGLEKSIIVNLADDCKIGVRASNVEITVTKCFQ
jgi:hypothetical protein